MRLNSYLVVDKRNGASVQVWAYSAYHAKQEAVKPTGHWSGKSWRYLRVVRLTAYTDSDSPAYNNEAKK